MRIYKIVRNPKISNTVVGLAFRDKYKGFSFYHFLVYSIVLVHWALPILRYESSTLILYKELSSPIFQSCLSVSQASVTPVQISTLCNI